MQGLLHILHADHSMIKFISLQICRRRLSVAVSLPNDLNPVPVRVQGEGDAPHLSVGKLLLEADGVGFEAGARGFKVVNAEADVAEASAWIGVAGGYSVVWVVLGAIVVRELQNGLPVGPVVSEALSFGRVEGEEVEGEFGVLEIESEWRR